MQQLSQHTRTAYLLARQTTVVLGKCPSSPPVSVYRQVTEHPTLRIYPVHKHPKDLLTCGVVRASCSWGAPTLPIRKIPPLAEAATLQSLKHCNSNLTWKCISTRLQNAPGSPTHHHKLHRTVCSTGGFVQPASASGKWTEVRQERVFFAFQFHI